MSIFQGMEIFSETTKTFFSKAIHDTVGSDVRAFFMSAFIFIIGGISGAFVVAGSIDPRVSAVEKDTKELRTDFLEVYKQFSEEIRKLEDDNIKNDVQVQMLILHQIPSSERDKLREEAETIIQSQDLNK